MMLICFDVDVFVEKVVWYVCLFLLFFLFVVGGVCWFGVRGVWWG